VILDRVLGCASGAPQLHSCGCKIRSMLEDLFNPYVLRPNLIKASVYIAAFEVLKSTIVQRIKSFYTLGPRIDQPKYESEVLSKDPKGKKRHVHASLAWLKESEAIDDDDIIIYERVKELRDKLAHQMAPLMIDGLPADLPTRFLEMIRLLDKIGKWWIVNVDSTEQVDESSVMPGPIFGLQLMFQTAFGSEEDSRKFLEDFRKLTGEQRNRRITSIQ